MTKHLPAIRLLMAAALLGVGCAENPVATPETVIAAGRSGADSTSGAGGTPGTPAAPAPDSTTQNAGIRSYSGTIVDVRDPDHPWKGVPDVTVTLVRVEAVKDTVVMSTVVSDAAGRFTVRTDGVNRGLPLLLVVPAAGSPYGKTSVVGLTPQADFSYVPLHLVGAPQGQVAPILAVGRVTDATAPEKGVGGARVEIWHGDVFLPDSAGVPRSASPIAPAVKVSGVADDGGYFIIEIPAPGLFQARAFAPAGSRFTDGAATPQFVVSGYSGRSQIIPLALPLQPR